MQMRPDRNSSSVWRKMSSAVVSFASRFGLHKEGHSKQEVTKLVHDKQLAVLAYLPEWSGFVVADTPAEIAPCEAIAQVQQVWKSVVEMKVTETSNGEWSVWNPQGFRGEAVCILILSCNNVAQIISSQNCKFF